MNDVLRELQRHLERAAWDEGDEAGFLAARSDLRDRYVEWARETRGASGYVAESPGALYWLRELAKLAFSLGDVGQADEAMAAVVAYYDADRRHHGNRADVHADRAMLHVIRGQYDAALAEYELAFKAGHDIDAVMRDQALWVVVDDGPRVLFEGAGFQALLERSRALRRATFERLQADAPRVLYPEEQLITQLHEEYVTDEWVAKFADRPKYRPEDLDS